MGISLDILRSWRHPRRIISQRLDEGVREDRVLVFLMAACALIFVAQWPALVRASNADTSIPLDARLGGALLAWMFIAPLVLYLVAAISRLVARLFGGTGTWYSARLALFWSLLAASPMLLLNGLLAGLSGVAIVQSFVGALALAGFFVIWLAALIETEGGRTPT
jgi:hypothetical protein